MSMNLRMLHYPSLKLLELATAIAIKADSTTRSSDSITTNTVILLI